MRKLVIACALAFGVMGCATVPSLDASPEDVADRIASDAVAYNEAYGRAIADQVLLNVLRARDRLPLYHLSMSGITEASNRGTQSTAEIGSIGLGAGGATPWATGGLSQQYTATTQPGYSLNPFGSNEQMRARQFQQAPASVFQHYWENNWPIEILFYVMVERLDVEPVDPRRPPDPAPPPVINNNSGAFRGDCGARVERMTGESEAARIRNALVSRCNFLWFSRELTDSGSRPTLDRITTGCAQPEAATEPRRTCAVRFAHNGSWYRVQLRAMDDMIYFVGSILRDIDDGADEARQPMTARVHIRPADVVAADGELTRNIARSAVLFRIVELGRGSEATFAAEVDYRGVRYAAGPPAHVICVGVTRCAGREGPHNDASARVLSLLTQLVILSQSEEAQLAPRFFGPSQR